jgi:outer membrane protein assembly factor BamB
MCVTADSGGFKWGIDIEKEFEGEIPLWYTGQCPLIDDSVAVIATGGTALLIGVHLESGEIVWRTDNPDGWKMSHSSIMPMTIHGKRMYVYCALGGMVGVSAEGDDRGAVLFRTTGWNPSVIAPSPLHLGDGRLFATAGYGFGSTLFQVNAANGSFTIDALRVMSPDSGLAAEQQTPIFHQNHLFAILPKDAGALRNQLVCADPVDPTNIIWSSGKTTRFGLGPFIIADGKFFILSDDGVLTLARVSTREYAEIARAKVLDGHDAWGPMAIVNGRLLCRDSRRMVCLDLRAPHS